MPKLIEFNIPRGVEKGKAPKEIAKAKGYRTRLQVGSKTVTFVLQYEYEDARCPCILAHYASGYRATNLNGAVLYRYVSRGYITGSQFTQYRQAAQQWLNNVVAERGEKFVLDHINSKPVLNP